ncbi:MAG: hypothetical protein AUK47_16475 [Deltaproteobacteria bacterium CG2_30_63_29]|nr:MAG: hypothetical protein AUK47_16475 [Deltaproteobacteria bacterium CG2_30_63_29]
MSSFGSADSDKLSTLVVGLEFTPFGVMVIAALSSGCIGSGTARRDTNVLNRCALYISHPLPETSSRLEAEAT